MLIYSMIRTNDYLVGALILSAPTVSLKRCVWCLKKDDMQYLAFSAITSGNTFVSSGLLQLKKKTTNKYPSLRFVRFLNQESCCTNMTHRPWWRRLTCSRQHNNGGCRGGSSWGRLVRQFVNGLSIKETSFFLDCQTIVCPASSDRI